MKQRLIIVGSGPAGYTAAIYAARAELDPWLFSGARPGGQLIKTTVVENWPGSKKGVMGPELMMAMREQAKRFGTEIIDENVAKVDFNGTNKKILAAGKEYVAEAVIVATGAEAIMLGVPGEKRLLGRGVAVCAVCDAPFYRGKTALVVGGGDAALEDALALAKLAKKVYIVHRRDQFRASKIMIKRVTLNSKIEVLWSRQLKEVLGENKVEAVKLLNVKTGKVEKIMVDGVFLAIGHRPATEIFKGQLELDRKGFIKTKMIYGQGVKEWLEGYPTETLKAGVFAAGDVVDFRYRQAITAAGMGCQAALDAEKYLRKKNDR